MHVQRSKHLLLVISLGLLACRGDDGNGNDEAAETGSEGIDPTESSETATDTSETTTDTSETAETDTSETGPAVCGNGMVEAGEECDDGNLESGDGCSATCQNESGLVPLPCNGAIYQCGNMIDDDQDGLIDLDDPECISPCDDNEASFQTDLPGQNNDCKGDCYFDSNSGGGDDKCEWNLQCDPENPGAQVGCPYNPDLGPNMCALEMPQECLDFCSPNVPNGCDCFGCCEVDGQFIYLDSSPDCSMANLDACESCTFYENCNNPCDVENCELCFGQDPEDLPDDCGPLPTCPPELQACLDTADCPEGLYCQTGCCYPIDIG